MRFRESCTGPVPILVLSCVLAVSLRAAEGQPTPSEAAKTPTLALCPGCDGACEGPLSHDDSLLAPAWDTHLPSFMRAVSTAAGKDMARAFRDLHTKNQAGHFGRAYRDNQARIIAILDKGDGEYSSRMEVAALRAVQAGLYRDTATGLRDAARRSKASRLLKAYQQNQESLDEFIAKSPGDTEMTAEQMKAVCDVLSAYKAK